MRKYAAHTTRGRVATHKNSFPTRPTWKTFRLVWSPEGREIARVDAATEQAAIRKAPLPYRRKLGEIYAEEVLKLSPAIFGDSKREQAEGVRLEQERVAKGPRRLLHPDGMEVRKGEILSSDGKRYRVTGWREPHSINSSGRVFVLPVGRRGTALRQDESYFPHVFDLKFEPECDRCGDRCEVNDNHMCAACAAK